MVLDDLAAQLGIGDPSCVKGYGERENTRLEHRRQICRETGWRDYADAAPELALWLDRRTWNTGESSRALFDGATGWLRQHQVLLPGVTTLTEDVARARRAAEGRLWARLAEQLTADQAGALVGLLDVPADSKRSALELLRRGPVDRTAKALVAALDRVAAVERIGVAGADLGMVPQRRVRELARDGMVRNATALRRRRPHDKRLATLLAAVVHLRAKATDDALELFDVIMANELLARAERASTAEKARRYPRLSRDAGRLAAAVEVLFEAGSWGEDITLDLSRRSRTSSRARTCEHRCPL